MFLYNAILVTKNLISMQNKNTSHFITLKNLMSFTIENQQSNKKP